MLLLLMFQLSLCLTAILLSTLLLFASFSKPSEKETKLAHAVLSDPSPIGRAACELVEEYTEKIDAVKENIEKAAIEHEGLQKTHTELRRKYHLATNANAQLRSENSRLKREIAALKKKEQEERE